jgi:Cu2+-containing amine oxidase
VKTRRLPLAATLALGLVAAATTRPAAAAGSCCPTVTERFPNSPSNEVIQEFPYERKMHTAWKVQFAHATARGLYITGAWFRTGPGKPWMKVLDELRCVDIFVPYHPGNPRFYDLTQYNFNLEPATPEDTGPCGEIIDGVVIKELRHHGVTWKDDQRVYRGSSLVLWATLDAANYNYIMEYEFKDDGTIMFGLGATARNHPGDELIAHTHDGLWRVDVDLNGSANDRATLVRHLENGSSRTAEDVEDPFGSGVEGSALWVADEYTTLRLYDTQTTNANGRLISYDLMPLRYGNSRHEEDFSDPDFWVTPYDATERFYTELPSYVSDGEPIDDTDIVVWTVTPVHHLPRDEDGTFIRGTWRGAALVMWTKAMLKPRNLFSRTPFFPY